MINQSEFYIKKHRRIFIPILVVVLFLLLTPSIYSYTVGSSSNIFSVGNSPNIFSVGSGVAPTPPSSGEYLVFNVMGLVLAGVVLILLLLFAMKAISSGGIRPIIGVGVIAVTLIIMFLVVMAVVNVINH